MLLIINQIFKTKFETHAIYLLKGFLFTGNLYNLHVYLKLFLKSHKCKAVKGWGSIQWALLISFEPEIGILNLWFCNCKLNSCITSDEIWFVIFIVLIELYLKHCSGYNKKIFDFDLIKIIHASSVFRGNICVPWRKQGPEVDR